MIKKRIIEKYVKEIKNEKNINKREELIKKRAKQSSILIRKIVNQLKKEGNLEILIQIRRIVRKPLDDI
jgi:hypothetical protein